MIRKNIILIILIVLLCNFNITKEKNIERTTIEFLDIPVLKMEEPIARIMIPKIRLDQPIYKKESKQNNIEKNVTILKESANIEEEGTIILAAHSGVGDIAYFQQLDQLERGDVIWLQSNQKQEFQVVKIEVENKTGSIHISKRNKKTLILTTCMPNQKGKQLIVTAEKKESA